MSLFHDAHVVIRSFPDLINNTANTLVPELNKYLNHHGLKQHLKSSKSDKVKAIVRHSCLQQKSTLRAAQPALRNARTLKFEPLSAYIGGA